MGQLQLTDKHGLSMLFIQPLNTKCPTKTGQVMDILSPDGQPIGKGRVYSVGIEIQPNIPFTMLALAGMPGNYQQPEKPYEILLVEILDMDSDFLSVERVEEMPSGTMKSDVAAAALERLTFN